LTYRETMPPDADIGPPDDQQGRVLAHGAQPVAA
jgi:hypothetical protein